MVLTPQVMMINITSGDELRIALSLVNISLLRKRVLAYTLLPRNDTHGMNGMVKLCIVNPSPYGLGFRCSQSSRAPLIIIIV